MKKITVLLLAALLAIPLTAFSQENALEVVKGHVNDVMKVLRDPSLRGEKGEAQKKAQIRERGAKLFDYVELSKRTLGMSWNRLNQEQRKEFVDLYRELLEQTYIDRITAYTDEKVEFTEAVPLGDNAFEVRSTVTAKTGQVPIHYRAMNEKGQWKVYDVVVEGVSLTANYRSQFREILINKPPEALLETLRQRVGEEP